MNNNQNSYRQIVKATSIFGGVQGFQIILAIIRSKFVAVLLGPAGMGIASLLNSTTELIASVTNFGLGTSAVKNISEANGSEDSKRIVLIASVFRRLVWITGLLGALVTIVLSRQLSIMTFGDRQYTVAFLWIAVTLLFKQLTSGQLVILQGLRKIKLLAKAGLIGSLLGLIVSIPLYYFFHVDGIVPAIILTSALSMLTSFYYSRKIEIRSVPVTVKEVLAEGKGMLVMGFLISLTGLLDQLMAYITRIYISNVGGVADVGLYNAGFSMVNTYVGMIFTAMLTDYYPRLSAVAKDNFKAGELINQQAETAILILAPIILLFFVFVRIVIVILFSREFLVIDQMIYWAMLGILFKAPNWAMGIILLAKGDSKLYFITYLVAALVVLGTNIAGYYFFGLKGLGISFLISFIILTAMIYVVIHLKYKFVFTKDFLRIFFIQLVLGVLCFLVIQFFDNYLKYVLGSVLISISVFYSYRELDKRLDLKGIKDSLVNRFRNRKPE